jgi:Domain of unknown function (DUF927)
MFGAGPQPLGLELFYLEPHRRVATAINQAQARGAVTAELVLSLLPAEDAHLVTEALSVAALGKAAWATAARLAELATQREEFFAACRAVREKGRPIEVANEHGNGNGNGKAPPAPAANRPGFLWANVEFSDAYMNSQINATMQVGADIYPITGAELREGTVPDKFPELKGVSSRHERDLFNEWARGRLAEIMTRPGTLPGYGLVAPEASAEGWAEICDLMAAEGRSVFFVGGALASYFLCDAGLDHRLSPLGFCLQAIAKGRRGKTTIQRVAGAVVGEPEKTVGSWGGSGLGLETQGNEVGRFPIIRSDTQTCSYRGKKLVEAIENLFEGPRIVSTRRGEFRQVGGRYKGILLSSGNEGICHYADKDRGAVLARVIELDGPLTTGKAQAERLAELALQHYGWPLQEVRAGRVTAGRFAELVNEAARVIAELWDEPDPDPVAQDVALRCAVVVAGAAVLGSLVGREELLFTAALGAALEVLERLSVTMDESHRPIGRALVEGLWEASERRESRYPLLDGEQLAEQASRDFIDTDGFRRYLGGEEQLANLPSTARRVAAELGISDINQAWAEAREMGWLVTRGDGTARGRYLNQLYRRDGDRARTVPVYIVRRPSDDDDGKGPTGTTPEPVAPVTSTKPLPGQTHKSADGGFVDRAPRESRELTPLAASSSDDIIADGGFADEPRAAIAAGFEEEGIKGPDKNAARGQQLYFRAVSDGERLWYWGGPETAPAGLAAVVDRVTELAGEQTPLLWLTPLGRQRLGLPAKPGKYLADAVTACRDAGLQAEKKGDRVVRAGPVLVHATEYGDRFTGLEGEQLWRALERFRATTRLEYVHSPGTTAGAMVVRAPRRYRLVPAAPEPELRPAIARSAWSVRAQAWEARRAQERPPGATLAVFDKNAAYLAAWRRCELPGDDWQELGPFELSAGRLQPGYYLVELGTLVAELDQRDLPPVFERCGAEASAVWVTAPLARLAGELADELGLTVRCQQAYVADGHRYLDSVAERLTTAYNALKADGGPEAAAALEAIKGMYAAVTLQFESHAANGRGRPELWRPAWCHTVIDRHAANTFRDLRAAGAVGWSNIDRATFIVERGGAPPGLRTGTSPGTWKLDQ